MPFFLWLRFITMQKLFQLHRRHLGTKARDAAREVSIYAVTPSLPRSDNVHLANCPARGIRWRGWSVGA
jgi:RNA polymerase sigma-70 factor (ECF subfamily)